VSCPEGKFVSFYAAHTREPSTGLVYNQHQYGAELRNFSGTPSLPQSIQVFVQQNESGALTAFVDVLCMSRP